MAIGSRALHGSSIRMTSGSTDNATTDSNHEPAQSNENPSDDSGDISINQVAVNVTIEDLEGDKFNWTIEGKYVYNNQSNGDTNGSKEANLITPLLRA